MNNYPPGAAGDPSAPYNQKDSDYWHGEKEGYCQYCEKEEQLDKDECCESCFYSHKENW
jgi:hypothetical protein